METTLKTRPREPRKRYLWAGVGATLFTIAGIALAVGLIGTGLDLLSRSPSVTTLLGAGGAVIVGVGFWWLAFDFCVESLERRGRSLSPVQRGLILLPAPALFFIGFVASFLITLGQSLARIGSVWFWLAFLLATAAVLGAVGWFVTPFLLRS